MKLSIHLTFCGQCEAAFRFYEWCLGGTIVTMLKYGDSPMAGDVSEEWREKIVHASLVGDGIELAGVDLPATDYVPLKGFFVLLDIEDPSEADRVFHTLSEGGSVQLPIRETFWATRFGVLVDQFGIPWEINCGRPSSNPA